MKSKTGINFCGNAISNVVAENLSTAPASPKEGQFYYNAAKGAFAYFNGKSWILCDPAQVLTFSSTSNGVLNVLISPDGSSEPTVKSIQIVDVSDFDTAGSSAAAFASAKLYTDNKISELMGGTPSAALDTLFELASAVEENKNLIMSLQSLAASGVHKNKVFCPALTPSSGVCTWICNHGLNMTSADLICKVYTQSGEEVICDVTINSSANVIIKIASDTNIAANSYYAVFVG